MRVGAYPGTFDPPTIAHLAIAEAAWRQGGLDSVELLLTRVPLGKEAPSVPVELRVAALEALAVGRPWMRVRVTDHQLLVDVCRGYDALVLGSDKWQQIHDHAWYGSVPERDRALARLPPLLLARRAPRAAGPGPDAAPVPPDGTLVLDLDPAYCEVSSTAVRAGRLEWRAEGARCPGRPDGRD